MRTPPFDRARPNVLYLVHRVPYPPDKGDRIRAFHVLKWLSQRAAVHLACLADEPVTREVLDGLEPYCERLAVIRLGKWSRWIRALASVAHGRTVTQGAFHSPALEATLGEWAGRTRFQVALASASSMVPYLLTEPLRDVPAVIDLVDVDSQKWLDYAATSRGLKAWLYRTEGRRLRRVERSLPYWFHGVTLVSEAEADLYRQFSLWGSVEAVSNGVDLDYFRPGPEAREEGCVFVGALDYHPNVDGADWFCREIWPEVRRRHPQSKIYLVGRRPVPAVRRLADLPGVELVGQVADVRPHVARAAVAVVPLRLARGLQNKVLEALAMGKATVASPQALAGLKGKPEAPVLTASSPREWVEAIDHLLANTGARQQLGSAGRAYVEEHYQWDSCLAPFGRLLGLPADARPAREPSLWRAEPLARSA